MQVQELLGSLSRINIYLQLQGNDLKIKGPKENLKPEIVQQIRDHKAELITYLQTAGGSRAGIIPAIEPSVEALYPLSSAQQRLWIMSQMGGSGFAFNIPGTYVFEGDLSINALSNAFAQLIERHESLRTIFVEKENGEVRQHILSSPSIAFAIEQHDLRAEPAQHERVRSLVQSVITTAFDLTTGPLLRASVVRLGDSKWVFTYVMHHIISDGWSMGVLIRELLAFYNARVDGHECSLPDLRIQYKDYAAWQLQQLSGASLQQHKDWWLRQFEGELPVLELPADRPRPLEKTYNGRIINRTLNASLTESLRTVCRAGDATLFMGLLATVNVLLHRYTGQQDIIVGSPIAGRDHADLEGQIGFYVNTLALRTRFTTQQTFTALLAQTRQLTLQAYEHQAYPFDELVNELHQERDRSRHPLFDVMVVLQNAGGATGARHQLNGLTVQEYNETESLGSKFDWLFIFNEQGNELHASIEYNSDIYNEDTVARAWKHFEQLLAAIVAQPFIPVNELDYLNADEKHELLSVFNNTAADYPKHKTLQELFQEHVYATPDNIALVFEDTSLTYAELNRQANRLANFIKTTYAIQPGDLVPVQLPRSAQSIIAMLAILKAGGAYVPIDTGYPAERIQFMVADCRCKVVIDEMQFELMNASSGIPDSDLPFVNTPDDLAYVMYTSGSTGTPKGAMIAHASITRLVKNTNYISFSPNDSVLCLSNFSFDGSTLDIYGALLNGARLVISGKDESLDPRAVNALIKKNNVTVLFIPTALLHAFIDSEAMELEGVRQICFGGEAASLNHVKKFVKRYPDVALVNGYGPTENTTFSTTYRITGNEENIVPIGKPLANSECYIVDSHNRLTPVGIMGEICVAGDGLARCYLNQPALTAEKFVPNPFRPGTRMYRTGDIGRWRADGNILCAGRKDDQVKIRGFRIEPGEIEAMIQNHPGVDAAVVIVRKKEDGEKELSAYFVTRPNTDAEDIRSYVSRGLPGYMVPAHFIQLTEFPLNHNGKIDKRNLPAPGENNSENTGYIAPRNETEEKLAAIWQEILGKERVGVKDDFFLSGGHSLKLTRLSSQLQKVFNVKPGLKELFGCPVLEQQAILINEAIKSDFNAIPAVTPQEHYALSPAQRRLWILSQFRESNVAYNIPSVYVFEGALDLSALDYALDAVVKRHESLRTVFRQDDSGEVRQYILSSKDSGFKLTCHDLQGKEQPELAVKAMVQQEVTQPFDLEKGPLLRAGLYQAQDRKWIFTYVLHHIVSDGWSMNILINELLAFYNARMEQREHSLQPLRIQYKDYAAWQYGLLHDGEWMRHASYWKRQFEGQLPELNLPIAKTRPAVKTYAGGMIHKRIPENVSSTLKSLCLSESSTLFMGLLAGVNALLYGYSRDTDIIIGTPIAGREHADLEDQIGLYINTLALRTRFDGQNSFQQLLAQTREVTLGAYQHQAYPFDELVDQLQLQRDAGRNALFDVMIVLQNTGSSERLSNPHGLDVSAYAAIENRVSAFDLTFNFIEIGEEIGISIEYNSSLFSKLTTLRMADDFIQLLETFTNNPALPLSSFIPMINTSGPGPSVALSSSAAKQKNRKELIDDLEL